MRVHRTTLAAVLAAASYLQSVSAFAPISSNAPTRIRSSSSNDRRSSDIHCPPLSAGPPIISNWRYESSKDTISGIVKNHPTITDGDRITTSPVKNPSSINENLVIQTKSGSKYKLSSVARGGLIPAVEAKRAKLKEATRLDAEKKAKTAAAQAEKIRIAEEKKAAAVAARAAKKKPSASPLQKVAAPKKVSPSMKPKSVPASAPASSSTPQINPAALQKLAKSTFSLTGATVGPSGSNGKYLLAGKPVQSSGRAAKIWTAYLVNPNVPNVPEGFTGKGDESKAQQFTVKLSPDRERLALENSNYNKVQSGLFSGRFVQKIDYIKSVFSNTREFDGKVSALVIESGVYDLKALLSARNGQPIRGRALRDAASAAGQCIQAVHSSNLVWTDLKTENFIVVNNNNFNKEVNDSKGSMGLPGVKGIDLESVIARGGNPIDYSPEACPPEFAKDFMGGYGEEFVLDYSYDMWSLGMMLYELSTGKPYFDKKSPSVVTKLLCDDTFEVDVSEVPDAKLRDLIKSCLSLDPRKRPDITGFLLHPYFLTTGFGQWSF